MEEFWLKLIALLDKTKSEKQLKTDVKDLSGINIKLIGTLDKLRTRAQLKKDLSSLDGTVNIKTKINKKDLNSSITDASQGAQKQASKNPIQIGLSLKKDKLINDIKILGQQNSKLFNDAGMSAKYSKLLNNAELAKSSSEVKNLRFQLAAMRSEIKATGQAGLNFGDSLKRTFSRATELFTGTGGVIIAIQTMRQAWTEALDLDKVETDLIKVQDELSRGDLPDYFDKVSKKAQKLATTQKELIEAITEFSKVGNDLSTSEAMAEKSTVLSNVGDMSASDSAKAIISGVQAYDVIDGYDDVLNKADALIDKYNEIGNTASITTAEIAQGVQSVGSVFADANTDVDQFISLLSAGNRQFQDADSLALGLRTSALRIRGASAELEKLGEDTEGVITSTSKLEKKIKGLTDINGSGGVNIMEADEKTFRNIYDIYVDIGKVYSQMSDIDQSALLDIIAGKNRASAVSATLNNMSEAQKIYQNSINSTGSAQKEYDKYLESSDASLNRFKATMTETYQSIINGDTASGLLDTGNAVVSFANDLGLVESTIKGFIAIGLVKGITNLSVAFKTGAIQASNFGKALNTAKDMSTMTRGTAEYTKALNSLKSVSSALSKEQLKQVLSSKALSDADKIAILRTTGLTKAQAQTKLLQMGLVTSTNAQTTAQAAATASTFSLTSAIKGFGASAKAVFMSNPIGISLMALSTIIGVVSKKASDYKQEIEDTRQANIEAATAAAEQAAELNDLYMQYSKLSGIQDKTSSQEEQFKTVIEDITKALGSKADALDGLTVGTDKYTEALKNATEAELESQYSNAKIGAKAAEEQLAGKTSDWFNGSAITIPLNVQMTGDKTHMEALDTVRDILKEYEDEGSNGIEWEPINWDSDADMKQTVEYYNSLVEARDKLATADNADALMDTDIYKDINSTINKLSESMGIYTEKEYEALKLEYEWQNGIPTTVEEYNAMEKSILENSEAGEAFKNIIKDFLAQDFSHFASGIEDVEELFNNLSDDDISIGFDYENADLEGTINNIQSAYNSLVGALEEYNEQGFLSMGTMDSLLALNNEYINILIDENGQLQFNQQTFKDLANVKLEEAKASVYQQACTELARIAKLNDAQAALDLAKVNGTLTESAYNAAEALYEEVKAMGNTQAALANNVWDATNKKIKLLDSQIGKVSKGTYDFAKVQQASAKSVKEEYEKEFDFYEQRIKNLTDAVSLLGDHLENVSGSANKNSLIQGQYNLTQNLISENEKMLAAYSNKAQELLLKVPESLRSAAVYGADAIIDMVGDSNKEVYEAITTYQSWADKISDVKSQIAQLTTQLRELAKQKFDNVAKDFEEQFDIVKETMSTIEKQINLVSESGNFVGEAYYQELVNQASKQLEILSSKKSQLAAELSFALSSGQIQAGTEEWAKMVSTLQRLDSEILDCKTDIEKFNNSIQDLHWKVFEKITDQFDNLATELGNILDVIDDTDAFNEDGSWSEKGITKLGLYAQQYELASYASQQYAKEIDELNAAYNRGEYTALEYSEKLAELNQKQWNSIDAAEEALKAIIALNEARVKAATDVIEKEIDAYEELTQAQIDNLDAKKDLWEWQQSVAEKTANVEAIQKQLIAMTGDDTAETNAKRKKLEAELVKAQKDLDDSVYEHNIDEQKKALQDQLDDFTKTKNAEIEALEATLKDEEELIRKSLELVKQNTTVVSQQLAEIAKKYGIDLSSSITNAWASGSNAIGSYGDTLSSSGSVFKSQLAQTQNSIYALATEANSSARSLASMYATSGQNLMNTLLAGRASLANTTYTTNALQDSLRSTLSSSYDVSGIVNALNQIRDAANSAASAIKNALNSAQSRYSVVDGYTGKVIQSSFSSQSEAEEWIKKRYGNASGLVVRAYAKGGVVGEEKKTTYLDTLANSVGEDKMVAVKRGEGILTKQQTDAFIAMRQYLPDVSGMIANMAKVDTPSASSIVKNSSIAPVLNSPININVAGDVSEKNIGVIKQEATKAINNAFKTLSWEAWKKGVRT